MKEETTEQNEYESQAFYVGLDLGQARDYTAVVVLEHVLVKERALETHERSGMLEDRDEYHVRHIKRLPLGTSYVDVIAHVKALLIKIEQVGQTGIRPHLVLDATAVGRPIVDMFRHAGLAPVAVAVHGGLTEHCENEVHRVPKRDLVASAKVLLGQKQLRIAKEHPDADVLVNELQSYQIKVDISTGHDSYQAWRENAHDDLLFALCLTCWYADKQKGESVQLIAPRVVGRRQGRFAGLDRMKRTSWRAMDFSSFR